MPGHSYSVIAMVSSTSFSIQLSSTVRRKPFYVSYTSNHPPRLHHVSASFAHLVTPNYDECLLDAAQEQPNAQKCRAVEYMYLAKSIELNYVKQDLKSMYKQRKQVTALRNKKEKPLHIRTVESLNCKYLLQEVLEARTITEDQKNHWL